MACIWRYAGNLLRCAFLGASAHWMLTRCRFARDKSRFATDTQNACCNYYMFFKIKTSGENMLPIKTGLLSWLPPSLDFGGQDGGQPSPRLRLASRSLGPNKEALRRSTSFGGQPSPIPRLASRSLGEGWWRWGDANKRLILLGIVESFPIGCGFYLPNNRPKLTPQLFDTTELRLLYFLNTPSLIPFQ